MGEKRKESKCRSRCLAYHLNYLLGQLHTTLECLVWAFVPLLWIHFCERTGRQQFMAQVLLTLPSTQKSWIEPRLLTLTRPTLGCCRHVGSGPAAGRIFFSISCLPFKCIPKHKGCVCSLQGFSSLDEETHKRR